MICAINLQIFSHKITLGIYVFNIRVEFLKDRFPDGYLIK